MEKDKTIGAEKLVALFDSGTFAEVGAYLKRNDGDKTGVVCGYGAVNGKLVYAFAQDSDRQKGAFDAFQAKKIGMIYDAAMKNGAPVVGLFDSIGAYVGDGASALSAYGSLLANVSRASGVIPQIAVITGVCSGMAATAAAMFDFTVTVKDASKWFVNAPFLIGKDAGTTEAVAANGLSAMTAESEEDALARVRRLIDLLPANCEEGVLAEEITDDVNRAVTVDGLTGKAAIEAIADLGEVIEIGDAFATEAVTAIARIGGVTCGFVASNAESNGGAITGNAAKKIAKLVSFCDAFGLPVVTLVDSEGVAVSAAEESEAIASALGKLAMAYATATTAKITVVIGKAYGASFTLMGSKALGGDTVYATSDASISIMKPESAVAFLWNNRITEALTRADLVAEWNETCAAPETAAADGSIDDVIAPAELRSRVCSAVYMLLMKSDGTPDRKHCNLPL
jgi:acetyl-CoA carboxylase carboxyltransferase component